MVKMVISMLGMVISTHRVVIRMVISMPRVVIGMVIRMVVRMLRRVGTLIS